MRASGSALPLPSGSADVALAILTMHHWDDWAAGLGELCRVAPRRIVLTMDFEMHASFWFLEDYVPEVGVFTRDQEPGHEAVAEVEGAAPAWTCQSFPCSYRGHAGRRVWCVLVPARGLSGPGGAGQLLGTGAGRPGRGGSGCGCSGG